MLLLSTNLCQVKGVKAALFRLVKGHDLDGHFVAGEVSLLDGVVEVTLGVVGVSTG